jgi:hypothetical protein
MPRNKYLRLLIFLIMVGGGIYGFIGGMIMLAVGGAWKMLPVRQ